MTLQELESAVAKLTPEELAAFSQWFEEFVADLWDRRIEEDVSSGRLDPAIRKADKHVDAGRCSPL